MGWLIYTGIYSKQFVSGYANAQIKKIATTISKISTVPKAISNGIKTTYNNVVKENEKTINKATDLIDSAKQKIETIQTQTIPKTIENLQTIQTIPQTINNTISEIKTTTNNLKTESKEIVSNIGSTINNVIPNEKIVSNIESTIGNAIPKTETNTITNSITQNQPSKPKPILETIKDTITNIFSNPKTVNPTTTTTKRTFKVSVIENKKTGSKIDPELSTQDFLASADSLTQMRNGQLLLTGIISLGLVIVFVIFKIKPKH